MGVISHKRKARSLGCLLVLVVVLVFASYYRHRTRSAETSILSVKETWVHKSWMEYPHSISFPAGPSLLNKASPKPLKVLIVNWHEGVENEIHAVLNEIVAPQAVHFTHTHGIGAETSFDVTEAASEAWYPLHRDHCNSNIYDLIIVGDLITLGRPYLQSDCKTNVILYITNRFDHGIWGDSEWPTLVDERLSVAQRPSYRQQLCMNTLRSNGSRSRFPYLRLCTLYR